MKLQTNNYLVVCTYVLSLMEKIKGLTKVFTENNKCMVDVTDIVRCKGQYLWSRPDGCFASSRLVEGLMCV